MDSNLPPKEMCSYQVDDSVITEYELRHNWDWNRGSGYACGFAKNELGDNFEGEAIVNIKIHSTGEERTYNVRGWLEHKTSGREMANKRVSARQENKMKTVKDFKDAGLVISEKDMIDGVTGDADSQAISIRYATNNEVFPTQDNWTIREFAWREKTSIMLGFIGKIECINEHGKPLKGAISYFACTKWRPLLNQNTIDASIETPEEKEALDKIFGADSAPSIKPLVYTQEMADNGEFPSVGMEFMHQGNVAVTLSTSKEHDGVITFTTDDGCSIGCCWFNDAWVKPIDQRTKKEKAIDAFHCRGEGLTKKASAKAFELIASGQIPGATFKGEE